MLHSNPDYSKHGIHEPPFSIRDQLNDEAIHPTIPDQPCIDSSHAAVEDFLRTELDTPILDDLFPHLWLVAAQSSKRIDAIHRQQVKGRRIVITEDPKLHLVWYSNVIYIKPIPQCLFNFEFWKGFLCTPRDEKVSCPASHLTRSALGFLRTYALLIRHPSDLHMAIEHHLIPGNIQWVPFTKFITPFRRLKDDEVSSRYLFGQLRLTRLNWAIRVFRPRSSKDWWYYHEMYWSTGAYVERFFAPLLFVFGSVTIILTAMQVLVTVPNGTTIAEARWVTAAKASWGFSVAMILFIACLWLGFVGGIVVFLTAQGIYATVTRKRKGRLGQKQLDLRNQEERN
ncbi:hypothetical protein BDR22DRAFT_890758 [Usnea florida]